MSLRAPIRVGIVGFGRMGKVRLDAVQRNPHLEAVAVCDTEPGRFDGTRSVRFLADYGQLLEMGVDAVFVCTPNRCTPDLVIRALEARKHVFCEKPPGRTLGDIQRIIEAEGRVSGLKLKFGFNHRYHAAIQEAKSLVDNDRLGKVLWVRGVYGKSGQPAFPAGWRAQRDIAGGGILLDQGIHMLDIFRLFCGEFREVKSYVTRAYWTCDVEDNAFALLQAERGPIAMLHSSATHWTHCFSLDICLTEGHIAINGILSGSRSYGRETLIVARKHSEGDALGMGNPREEVTYFDRDISWQSEVDDFADCILAGKAVRHGTSTDALRAMELVYKIYWADAAWASAQGLEANPFRVGGPARADGGVP